MRKTLAAAVTLCLTGFALSCASEQPTEPGSAAMAASLEMGGNSATVEFVPVLDGFSFTLKYSDDKSCTVELTGVTPEDFQRTNPDGTVFVHVADATADMTFVLDGVTYTGTVRSSGEYYFAWYPPNPSDAPPPREYVWQWRVNAVGWVTDGEVTKKARCWNFDSGLAQNSHYGMTLK